MALVDHSKLKLKDNGQGVRTRQNISREFGASSSFGSEMFISPGASVRPHYHDTDSVIVFLSGEYEIRQGNETWCVAVSGGYTLVSGPGVVHTFRNIGQTEGHIYTFHPKLEIQTTPAE